jgi:Na+-driven multidrug efflux pump
MAEMGPDAPTKEIMPKLSGESWGRVKSIFHLAWPNSATYLVQIAIQTGSMVFVGRLGPDYMGAAVLGTMMANLTGFSVGLGFATALEALCSQAYGAGKYSLVGRHAQRAMVILTLACLPLALIWSQTELILNLLGLSDISSLAGHYTTVLIIGMWPWFMTEVLRRYLQAQAILWPIVLSTTVVAIVNVPTNYMLIFYFDLGLTGAALSTACAYWYMFICMASCILIRRKYIMRYHARTLQNNNYDNESKKASRCSNCCLSLSLLFARQEKTQNQIQDLESPSTCLAGVDISEELEKLEEMENTWPSIFSKDVFKGWVDFFRLGLPGSVSMFLEWGSYEATAAIAGNLGTTNLAVHTVFMQTVAIWYMIPLGVASATSTLVGRALGSGQPEEARKFAKTAMGMHFFYGLINGAFFCIALRTFWPYIFTSDTEVVNKAVSSFWILWAYGSADSMKCVGMGILRGCGRPTITVIGNLVSCCLIGLPISALLTLVLVHLELIGLWTGMTTSWVFAAAIYAIVIIRMDWNEQVEKAKERNQRAMWLESATEPMLPKETTVDSVAPESPIPELKLHRLKKLDDEMDFDSSTSEIMSPPSFYASSNDAKSRDNLQPYRALEPE